MCGAWDKNKKILDILNPRGNTLGLEKTHQPTASQSTCSLFNHVWFSKGGDTGGDTAFRGTDPCKGNTMGREVEIKNERHFFLATPVCGRGSKKLVSHYEENQSVTTPPQTRGGVASN